MIPLGKISTVLGIVGSLGAGVVFAWPLAIGDYPPLSNVARVELTAKMMLQQIKDIGAQNEAATVRGNIIGAWRSCRADVREKNIRSAEENAATIATLQSEYMRLTGLNYTLPPCP